MASPTRFPPVDYAEGIRGAWTTTDQFSLATNQDTGGSAITADPAGNLFGAGYGYDSDGAVTGWLVRRKLAP